MHMHMHMHMHAPHSPTPADLLSEKKLIAEMLDIWPTPLLLYSNLGSTCYYLEKKTDRHTHTHPRTHVPTRNSISTCSLPFFLSFFFSSSSSPPLSDPTLTNLMYFLTHLLSTLDCGVCGAHPSYNYFPEFLKLFPLKEFGRESSGGTRECLAGAEFPRVYKMMRYSRVDSRFLYERILRLNRMYLEFIRRGLSKVRFNG